MKWISVSPMLLLLFFEFGCLLSLWEVVFTRQLSSLKSRIKWKCDVDLYDLHCMWKLPLLGPCMSSCLIPGLKQHAHLTFVKKRVQFLRWEHTFEGAGSFPYHQGHIIRFWIFFTFFTDFDAPFFSCHKEFGLFCIFIAEFNVWYFFI